MDLLEQIKKIADVDSALGLRFCRGKLYAPMMPVGGHLIGYTDSVYFCFVDGFESTVFAVIQKDCYGSSVYPIAYDFREFLRLILACGSADVAASVVFCRREHFSPSFFSAKRKDIQDSLRKRFDLQPMEDPYSYVQTVRQVIDYSSIRC